MKNHFLTHGKVYITIYIGLVCVLVECSASKRLEKGIIESMRVKLFSALSHFYFIIKKN